LDSTGLFVPYRSFWVLSLPCLLPPATLFLCPYAGPTYSIVLTIVHYDGTSTLSLHTIFLNCYCSSNLQLLFQIAASFLNCHCSSELLLLSQITTALLNCYCFSELPSPATNSILHVPFALMHGKPCTISLPLPFPTLSSAKKLVNLRSIYYNNNIFILKLKTCLS